MWRWMKLGLDLGVIILFVVGLFVVRLFIVYFLCFELRVYCGKLWGVLFSYKGW